MKLKDIVFITIAVLVFLPFFVSQQVYAFYESFNRDHPLYAAFIKFAILATAGESIGLRIKTGNYNQKGFGIMPKALVWGLLGLTIQMAFVIFSVGTTAFLSKTIGLGWAADYLDKEKVLTMSFEYKLLIAFSISTAMNLIYAPVMMTFHKITDMHISANAGTFAGLFRPIRFSEIFKTINWEVQWSFVFKKTIPFFWIPAHTITFMLPPEFRVLFAALLGIALGVIMAIAVQKGK